MSYLTVPRLHFAGTFAAKIGHINNTCSNFEPGASIAPIDEAGTNEWQFDCKVTRVCYADGTTCESHGEDPIVTAPVAGISDPDARLVDLDPQQQGVSQVWGFKLQVGRSGDSVAGDYAVAAFYDMWSRDTAGAGGDMTLGAYWQSVLKELQWEVRSGSRFLSELKAASPDVLSIKFVVDEMKFPIGRVVGTIGAATADEPERVVDRGRLLRAPQGSRLNTAVCEVDDDRGVLTLDLGNSIPMQADGPAADIGEMTLVVLPEGQDPVSLGRIEPGDYERTAFIQEFPVGPHLDLLRENPVAVHVQPPSHPGFAKTNGMAPRFALQEHEAGTYLRADQFVFRMNAEDPQSSTATVDLFLRKFGCPVPGATITLEDISTHRGTPLNWGGGPGGVPPVGTPPGALRYPRQTGPTDENGRASFELQASDPGYPRKDFSIDGQVYAVAYHLQGEPIEDWLSVLVHTVYEYSGTPTWTRDVGPIFTQYAQLYPIMSFLATYEGVQSNAAAIRDRLSLPMSHSAYMPVVRDLSTSKLKMILHWFEAGMPK